MRISIGIEVLIHILQYVLDAYLLTVTDRPNTIELQTFKRTEGNIELHTLTISMTSISGNISHTCYSRCYLHLAPVNIEQIGTDGKQVANQVDTCTNLVVPAILRLIRTLIGSRERLIETSRLISTCYRCIEKVILGSIILQRELWCKLCEVLCTLERLTTCR